MKIKRVSVLTLTRMDLSRLKEFSRLMPATIDYVRFTDTTTEEEFKASSLYQVLLPCINSGGTIIYTIN